jgi:hypothetical protein
LVVAGEALALMVGMHLPSEGASAALFLVDDLKLAGLAAVAILSARLILVVEA